MNCILEGGCTQLLPCGIGKIEKHAVSPQSIEDIGICKVILKVKLHIDRLPSRVAVGRELSLPVLLWKLISNLSPY